MKNSVKKGMGFGIASGVITTLGLIIGLYASTSSKGVIVGGIMIIAIADSLSDAFGIHLSEEYGTKKRDREIWIATFSTLGFKFLSAIIFLLPFLFLEIFHALIASFVWGVFLILFFSYVVAKQKGERPLYSMAEHFFITILVVVLTYFIGKFINSVFVF